MDSEPVGVFVVTLEGIEAEAALTVLAFVKAETAQAAEITAAAELHDLGWTDVKALRSGEVVDAGALPEDFGGALATALQFGCGLIIYDEG